MGNTTDKLKLFEAVLTLIEQTRRDTGDPQLGAAIERAVIDSQVKELELEIFDNPGAIEPWLIRLRRGEA
jgi:hypothetical protein